MRLLLVRLFAISALLPCLHCQAQDSASARAATDAANSGNDAHIAAPDQSPAKATSKKDKTDEIVNVHALANPVDKSYRKMIAGMDAFEENRSLAPNAVLRFKLWKRLPDTDMRGIKLKIVGDTFSTPVAVADDNTFTLERNQQALDEAASVMPNRKAHSMTWRADVRTPGLPPGARRLGDIRLECKVGFKAGLVSEGLPLVSDLARTMLNAASLGDICGVRNIQYLLFTDRPLFKVTLVSGERKMDLSIDDMYAGASYNPMVKAQMPLLDCQSLQDRTYVLPLWDKSWPDDTLIYYEYMDDDVQAQQPQAPAQTASKEST